MKELKTRFGHCKITNGKFIVDEEVYAEDINDFSSRIYKNEIYIFLRKKNLQYHVFSLNRRQFITRIFDKLVYETKKIIITISGSENKQKYYLYDLTNNKNSRTIKSFAHTYVLEKDGMTLTNITKRALSINSRGIAMPLPKACNALCTSTFSSPYCITEDNKILFLPPYPYNEEITEHPTFWELTSFVKPAKLKKWEANHLIPCLTFNSEEEKKLFCLVGILFNSRGNGKTLYQDNIHSILSNKKISFIKQCYHITLTLDEILIENLDKSVFYRFAYSIFDLNSSYLNNLLCYIEHQDQEILIDSYVKEKITLDEILKNTSSVMVKKILYSLNSHPTNHYFYVVSSSKNLIKVNRDSFVAKIVQGVLKGKNFRAVLNYYNLNYTIVLPIIRMCHKKVYREHKGKFH